MLANDRTEKQLSARLVQYHGRMAVRLSNSKASALIDLAGGMVSEFGLIRNNGLINAHWIPDFRANSGERWDEGRHAPFWQSELLYNIAGDFPCGPNFGGPCTVDGFWHPAHGRLANDTWQLLRLGATEEAAFAVFELPKDTRLGLSWKKTDYMLADHPVHYSIIEVTNHSNTSVAINLAHHNTLGAPFLQAGCAISLPSRRFISTQKEGDFLVTARLAYEKEFDTLTKAPLKGGSFVDASIVPGIIGATDLIVGAIPESSSLGWSACYNPVLKLLYMSFFPGPAASSDTVVGVPFNILWMQYGGRNFTPWAVENGASDRSFCLGMENGVAAMARGLGYARENPVLLGSPTLFTIRPQTSACLNYANALIEGESGDMAIESIEAESASRATIHNKSGSRHVELDMEFARAP